jgi:UDP-N-acetylglucosamine diphosphorylase / glucose-1-phosphate thymidylyltransferase / UDP-N-acetylgalactosamine diphosphorylase / glucosamine-1-phosphate N-acetyltransferase / galactosamine-1-phosphate N-acetyltransferase
MAGLGSRFSKEQFPKPKALIQINSEPMITRAVNSLDIDGDYHFVIQAGEYSEELRSVINNIPRETNIIEINYLTSGPAKTALLMADIINSNQELVIANCDQIMEWDGHKFLHNARRYDGAVVTYFSTTNKNSYAKLDSNGNVVEIREKEVISSTSLNGIHYWKKGSHFVNSAEDMIIANDRAINGEFYIGPSYNYMIKRNLNVGIYHIPNEMHHAVGVPDDLIRFINYENSKT